MGLDMYLNRETYIGGKYDHREVKGKVDLSIMGKKMKFDIKKISSIVEEVGYWRKANQIHSWFVRNVQQGRDECQKTYLEMSKLRELYDLVCKSLESKDSNLLTPMSGFFFGSTDIDKCYWRDLKNTKKILKNIFKEDPDGNKYRYSYQSSW